MDTETYQTIKTEAQALKDRIAALTIDLDMMRARMKPYEDERDENDRKARAKAHNDEIRAGIEWEDSYQGDAQEAWAPGNMDTDTIWIELYAPGNYCLENKGWTVQTYKNRYDFSATDRGEAQARAKVEDIKKNPIKYFGA